jgi:hypothetical protein
MLWPLLARENLRTPGLNINNRAEMVVDPLYHSELGVQIGFDGFTIGS